MIAQFPLGIDTQTIDIIANQPTVVIFGDANNQAIITGYYLEDEDGNYIEQAKFTQPALDRIQMLAINTTFLKCKITVFGGMLQTPVPPQVSQTLIRR